MKKDNIAIFHSAPRLGDILIHLSIYYSISVFENKKIIFITHDKELAFKILKDVKFIFTIVEFKQLKKNFLKNFVSFLQIKKTYDITKLYILEKNINPSLFAYFSRIKSIYSYGIKTPQRFFINNPHISDYYFDKVEYDQAKAFLNKLNINENKFYFHNNFKTINAVFICNLASDEKRRWPIDYLEQILEHIQKKNKNIKIFLNVSSKDFNYLLSKKMKNIIHTLNLSLDELKIIIQKSKFTFSIDTGPSHLSIRYRIKTYVLFSCTIPQMYSSYLIPITSNKIKNKNKLEIRNYSSKDISVRRVLNYLNENNF